MKIKLYNENNIDEKETKEEKVEIKKPKYIVKEKRHMGDKVKNFIFGILGGAIGGAIVLFVLVYFKMDTPINKSQENSSGTTLDNKSSTTSYNFSTVENPAVAIAENVSKSVVGIKVSYKTESFFGGISDASGEGSGIVYSEDGYIITNYHVIEEALTNSTAKIYVLFTDDDTEYEASIVGSDELTDLAVIKINKKGLTAAVFGDSDEIKVGDIAIAIGNPLGQEFAGTLTGGYISAVNRTITTNGKTYNLIQTDAAINSGNSGGALVSSSGKVIGINTAKIVATGVEGIGFAMPINDSLEIIEQLIKDGKILRPYIGIGGVSISAAQAKMYNLVEGVYIQQIDKDGPAYLAGIKQGDVITKINSQNVKSVPEINEIKNKLKKGDSITVTIYRDKSYKDIKVTLGEN